MDRVTEEKTVEGLFLYSNGQGANTDLYIVYTDGSREPIPGIKSIRVDIDAVGPATVHVEMDAAKVRIGLLPSQVRFYPEHAEQPNGV